MKPRITGGIYCPETVIIVFIIGQLGEGCVCGIWWLGELLLHVFTPGCGNTLLGKIKEKSHPPQAMAKICGSRCQHLQSGGVQVARKPGRPLPGRKLPAQRARVRAVLLMPQG